MCIKLASLESIEFSSRTLEVLLPSALARGNINRDLFSGYMYVGTYVRSSAQARTSIQYRLGVYRKLGACETRFIAFATLNATF